MKAPSFEAVRPDYARLWGRMTIRPERQNIVNAVADRLIARKPRYQAVERATRVPWFVIALIHEMEAGGRFDRHLHNGDPLSDYTRQVPAGRPRVGHPPPFSWEESAIDAIRYDGLDRVDHWSVERVCYELEKYNGWGTRAHGVPTPYLWSFSNNYARGKYVADHVWSAEAVSQQCGAMPVLRRMMLTDHSVAFGPALPPDVPMPMPVPPKPAPSRARHVGLWGALGAAAAAVAHWLGAHLLVIATIAAAAAFACWLLWPVKHKGE